MSRLPSQLWIEIEGAREHNLHNVSLRIPHHALTVVTGVSGSGKSSLVFDVLYMEGQRRYLEMYSIYTSHFAGRVRRPAVTRIEGISPVIAIRQDTYSHSVRSTVGTFSDIYDFLRLLFARVSVPVGRGGKPLLRLTPEQIAQQILETYSGKRISILARAVHRRKGQYTHLFDLWRKEGFSQVRVNNISFSLHQENKIHLHRYHLHTIDLVIDTFTLTSRRYKRLLKSVYTALEHSPLGVLLVYSWEDKKENLYSIHYFDPDAGEFYPEPQPETFSFNSPQGWCPHCRGTGNHLKIDLNAILVREAPAFRSLKPFSASSSWEGIQNWVAQQLRKKGHSPDEPAGNVPDSVWMEILNSPLPSSLIPPEWHEEVSTLADMLIYVAEASGTEKAREWARQFLREVSCPHCQGTRLSPTALRFRIAHTSIGELSLSPITDVWTWVQEVPRNLNPAQKKMVRELLQELESRLKALVDVGLGYLHLHRTIRSLSGGEAQRLRIATQLGAPMTGVLYILDEPTIGMHPVELPRLLTALRQLVQQKNTVIVVEHDVEVMKQADYLVELGPGGGPRGGQILYAGWKEVFLKSPDSLTARYIRGERAVPVFRDKSFIPDQQGEWLVLSGATGNNLKNVTLRIPLGCLVGIAGVSGSGKSTLILDTLYPALRRQLYGAHDYPLPFRSLKGVESLKRVVAVDQDPIGTNPRSVPATYIQVWDAIRRWYAQLPESRARAYQPGHFSFNTSRGACPTCRGAGMLTVQMRLLPDVRILCPECRGLRYKKEILQIRYRGKHIADVLQMTFEEALEFFQDHPEIRRPLEFVCEIGLGYLTLGQPSPTLSGGEAQRIKIAREIRTHTSRRTLYILDEPTTGLHPEDVHRLLKVLRKLVERGHTVLVIEHNLDVLKNVDYLVELGPGPAEKGGYIIAEGTPEEVAEKDTPTGQVLREVLSMSGYREPSEVSER